MHDGWNVEPARVSAPMPDTAQRLRRRAHVLSICAADTVCQSKQGIDMAGDARVIKHGVASQLRLGLRLTREPPLHRALERCTQVGDIARSEHELRMRRD